MESFEIFLVVVLVAVAAFQGWLTVQVFKSALYDRKQKVLQAQLIWLLPILGSGLVFTMLRDDLPSNKTTHTQDK
jgi:putative copper export protein